MRYREFLLEYDRSKTYSVWWPRLATKIMNDVSIRNTGPMGDVKNQIFANRHDLSKLRIDSAIVVKTMNTVEAIDPTPNKEYVQWILQRFCDGGIQRWEDMERLTEYLEDFHNLKKSGFFRRHPEEAVWADIGRFKRLSELGAFNHRIAELGGAVSNAQKDRDEDVRLVKEGAAVILADTPTLKIVIPKTWEASKYFGRNTQWCTAMKDNPAYFETYSNQGSLYIVLDKPKNRRFQLHFESGQFMDETDSPIDGDYDDSGVGWAGFPSEAWQYIDVTKMDDLAKANFLARSYCITEFDKVKKSCDTRTLALASAWAGAYFINPGVPASMSKKVGGEINVFNSLESFIGYTIRHHDSFYDHDSQDDNENPICMLMDILRGEIPGTDTAPTWWDVDEIFTSFRNSAVFEVLESETEVGTYMMFLETANHETGLSQVKNATAVVVKLGSLQTYSYGNDDLDVIINSKTDVTQEGIGLALAYLMQHAK